MKGGRRQNAGRKRTRRKVAMTIRISPRGRRLLDRLCHLLNRSRGDVVEIQCDVSER